MRIEQYLLEELSRRRPASLIAEGAAALALAGEHAAAQPGCTLAGTSVYAELALAVIDSGLDRAAGIRLIGRLKQRAPVVLVVAEAGSPLDFSDYLALGMQRLLLEGDGRALYGFDLYTYKPAPDWLNAKYWAHPGLWKP